ncbi:MAG: metal ABC transporter ATP-binding protein [Treponema sp.]|nr:metal ABC transporter ATP-binding protein [Treponema sp.]
MKEQSTRPILNHPRDRKISLRFEGVSFSYGNFKVLENAGFHIHQGEFIALVGPNGSGKTTVLKLLLGLEQPQRGKIDLFDSVGYVPQQAAYDPAFPISVWEAVKMGRLAALSRKFSAQDRAAVTEALEQAEITDLANRPYAALSGGQRRRVLLARALAAKPDILILDEPTANMDRESEERLFITLGKLKGNTTILIVTHDTGFVSALTDRVLCIGSREAGAAYGIVQHRTEAEGDAARIIHGESIPGDQCGPNGRLSGDVP